MDLNDWGQEGATARSDAAEAARQFRAQFPHCPEPAMVQAAKAGVLPDDIRDRVNQHVAECAACATLANDLFTLDEAPLEAVEQERIWGRIRTGIAADELKPAAARSGWWQFLLRPLPLAVVAAAVVLAVIGMRSMQQSPGPTVAVTQPASPVAYPPARSVLQLEKPPVMMPAAAVLVWRGADSGNAAREELQKALAPYEAGRYGDAVSSLTSLSSKYPQMAEAHFYLGVSLLFQDQNADAAASLKTAQGLASNSKTLAGAAAWYLALAYHRTGRDNDARPLLESLCSANGDNSSKACAGLKELPVVH
jgi:hypothetical protein